MISMGRKTVALRKRKRKSKAFTQCDRCDAYGKCRNQVECAKQEITAIINETSYDCPDRVLPWHERVCA